MPLLKVSADHAVRPAGLVAVPSRVLTLITRLRFRRALKAGVGLLLSMLSASSLGSRRVVGLFSAEVKGIPAAHQHLGKSLCCRKPAFLSWFKFYLLFCLLLCTLCFTLFDSLSCWDSSPLYKHYQKLFNQTRDFHVPQSYLPASPKEINGTTNAPTTVAPTLPTTVAPTHPPTVAPTHPPTVAPTHPPTVAPTHPTTVAPTHPTTVAPTHPTTVAPTHPPIVAPTVASTAAPPGTQYHQAYARNYHFIMDNKEVCKNQTPFLVLMVPVAPNNLAARNAIRQTWGNKTRIRGEVVLTMFMLGSIGGNVEQLQEKLKQENKKHHDLIQSDFRDSYKNLTIKTMVIMDWLATRCPSAAYAMKIDSDMFLNIDNLVIMLKKPGIPKQNYLTGMLMSNCPVVRWKPSKWYVPEEMYPDPKFPTYTLGMGYVLSNDLPEKFLEISKSIKPFNIEDAYIGMCMKKLGLKPSEPPNPSQFKAYNTKYNRCSFSKVITYILESSQQLIDFWTDLKKPGPPCEVNTAEDAPQAPLC
ncbi:beta-1,3-galactosyltransferase 5-like [Halichoeres trimaculatus]|uniref:beta-1,3-galactosyltransferase 5-like n=1 Tax=Halichoeres trimaculatus TaxID=147232 RepID=UPI003D9F5CCA